MLHTRPFLLIEDDDVDVLSLKRAFRELNIPNPLINKRNGEEALEYLTADGAELPGLILLDLNMPRMNGIEFLIHLKKHKQLKLIPVVMLTTSSNRTDVEKCFEYQAAGYMVKPIDFSEFKKNILHICNYWNTSQLPY
ncbi:MAG: response regulator [Bacteroidia bacterium]